MMEKRAAAQILGDDVFALEGLRCAVDGGDRRSQLMGDGRDEICLELLQPPLLSQIAECVNSPLGEAHPGDREPELTTLQLDRKRRRRTSGRSRSARDADGLRERLPAENHFLDGAAEHSLGRNACDRLSGRVPKPNHSLCVDEEDAVGDIAEHPGSLSALLGFPIEPSVLDRDCGAVSGEPKQAGVVGREVARGQRAGHQHADDPSLDGHRHRDQRADRFTISSRTIVRVRSAEIDFPMFVDDASGDPCSLGELDGCVDVCVGAGRRAEDERSVGALDQEDRGRVDCDDLADSLEQLAEHALERQVGEHRPGDALQAFESFRRCLRFPSCRTLAGEEGIALFSQADPFQRVPDALHDRLEQGNLRLVEGLVVEARDADDTAIDLAGEWHENELLNSDREQIALVQLRLLTGQEARASFVVEQVRTLLGR